MVSRARTRQERWYHREIVASVHFRIVPKRIALTEGRLPSTVARGSTIHCRNSFPFSCFKAMINGKTSPVTRMRTSLSLSLSFSHPLFLHSFFYFFLNTERSESERLSTNYFRESSLRLRHTTVNFYPSLSAWSDTSVDSLNYVT